MRPKQPITIDGIRYESLTAAAKAIGVTTSAIAQRVKRQQNPNPRTAQKRLVALRIDARTVIMVTPDKATPEYAELWKARHEAAQKGDRHDWIGQNDLLDNKPKRKKK